MKSLVNLEKRALAGDVVAVVCLIGNLRAYRAAAEQLLRPERVFTDGCAEVRDFRSEVEDAEERLAQAEDGGE